MVVLSVMYPQQPGMRFDEGYYLKTHTPLLHERWGGMGLKGVRLLRGAGAPGGGEATYRLVALLEFESQEAMGRCLSAHGREIMGDIPNYTDIAPVMQISEVVVGP